MAHDELAIAVAHLAAETRAAFDGLHQSLGDAKQLATLSNERVARHSESLSAELEEAVKDATVARKLRQELIGGLKDSSRALVEVVSELEEAMALLRSKVP